MANVIQEELQFPLSISDTYLYHLSQRRLVYTSEPDYTSYIRSFLPSSVAHHRPPQTQNAWDKLILISAF